MVCVPVGGGEEIDSIPGGGEGEGESCLGKDLG